MPVDHQNNAPRVGHLIKGLGRGGAEMLLPQLVRAGSCAAYSAAYFLPWKDALVSELLAAGARVVPLAARSPLGMLARVPAVVRWLRRDRIDVLHAHLPLAGAVARLAGKFAGVPVVYTEHNLQERYHPATRRANRWSWRWQDHVIAVSDEVAKSIAAGIGSAVPVTVVRNGIEVESYAGSADDGAACRRELGVSESALLVGTVGVFRVQKRLDLWLEVARKVLDQRPDTRFLLVGDGPLRGELEEKAGALGLFDAVCFPGLQENTRPFLSAMDLFLISSQHEGLPLALLEAMAAGVPIVTTAAGGIPEVVEDRVTGRVVAVGDVEGLSKAAIQLIDAPDDRARLSIAARDHVTSHFSIERMAREVEAVYSTVISGNMISGVM